MPRRLQRPSRQPDPRISPIFYYFAAYTNVETGRTVGRKIGVVQEIIVRKQLLQSREINDRIVFEPQVPGASGAAHKVEFVLLSAQGIVEGREGERLKLGTVDVVVRGVDPGRRRARLLIRDGGESRTLTVAAHEMIAMPSLRARHLRVKVSRIGEDRVVRLVLLREDELLASIESKRVGAQRFAASDVLGSGIQTIEKAKQAALAALDIDLLQNGTIKPLARPRAPRRFLSFVVLGNGVHWTDKDKAILGKYVDYTFLVPDVAIIRYADFVRARARAERQEFMPFFMGYFQGMTRMPADEFVVSDVDFVVVVPAAEARPMMRILKEHIRRFNPL